MQLHATPAAESQMAALTFWCYCIYDDVIIVHSIGQKQSCTQLNEMY